MEGIRYGMLLILLLLSSVLTAAVTRARYFSSNKS